MKLFRSATWLYKSIININIHPIHFCVSCTYFLCGVCIGRMKGTHKGIYTVGLGYCLNVLSGIAISSFSPGSCPRRMYFSSSSLVLQCHTVGGNIWNVKKQLPPSSWYTCVYKGNEVCPTLTEGQIKTVHLRADRERYMKMLCGDITGWVILKLVKKHWFLFMSISEV